MILLLPSLAAAAPLSGQLFEVEFLDAAGYQFFFAKHITHHRITHYKFTCTNGAPLRNINTNIDDDDEGSNLEEIIASTSKICDMLQRDDPELEV